VGRGAHPTRETDVTQIHKDEPMPPIVQIVETAVYVDDLERAAAFYRDVLGLVLLAQEAGRSAFFRVGDTVLLLFNPDETIEAGHLPLHGSKGPGHFALGIARESFEDWRHHLTEHGVTIESEVTWPAGGRSLYFRDPAGNVAELVTPGVWGLPSGW
jgi:catechol 2,3-dioxygenase-like lactoylglutathione lyase family enzyme